MSDPHESSESPTGEWGWDESVLVFSAPVEDPSRRSVPQHRLAELSDLIGRSPDSISLKLAGYRALERGESHRTRRVSSIQRSVYREYAGRPELLLAEAARLRAGRLRALPTVRIETAGGGLSLNEAQSSEESGFPADGYLRYQHGRGAVNGIAISSTRVLGSFSAAVPFARSLSRIAGPAARESLGFRRVRQGDVRGFGRALISWKFPTVHLAELPAGELAGLALHVARREVHSVFVSTEDAARTSEEAVHGAREMIREVLRLPTGRLCRACTVCLGYVAHQVERKSPGPA